MNMIVFRRGYKSFGQIFGASLPYAAIKVSMKPSLSTHCHFNRQRSTDNTIFEKIISSGSEGHSIFV